MAYLAPQNPWTAEEQSKLDADALAERISAVLREWIWGESVWAEVRCVHYGYGLPGVYCEVVIYGMANEDEEEICSGRGGDFEQGWRTEVIAWAVDHSRSLWEVDDE